MDDELATVLVSVYCIIDDLYRREFAARRPIRRGPPPRMSDSEVLTLTVLAQWHPSRSERQVLRLARREWRSYFPTLLSQSAFNRRVRDLAGVLSALGPALAVQLAPELVTAAYQVLDGVPLPLLRRCRGDRRRLFATVADVGRGGSDHDWYYGQKLLLAVLPSGLITGYVSGPASINERWLVEALLRWRVCPAAPPPTAAQLTPVLSRSHHRHRCGPTGELLTALSVGQPSDAVYLGDRGFCGTSWQHHWRQAYGATVLTTGDPLVHARPPAPPTEAATTAPPTEAATTAPPTEAATTAPPTEAATTAPPTEAATTAPPTEAATTAPPTEAATTAPPTEAATTAPPTEAATTAPPTEAATTAPPTEAATTAPPTEAATTAPPTEAATTAPPTEAATTAPPTEAATAADRAARRAYRAWLSAHRQRVEQVNGLLTQHLGLVFCGARTIAGLIARIAAKVTAVNLTIILNARFARRPLAWWHLF